MISQVQEATEQSALSTEGRGDRTLNTLRRAVFMISLPFGILHFLLPIYGREIGADAVQIGLFFSAFSLMTVLLRPLVGVGLDRYGRRPFFLAGLAGYAVTMFTFAFSADVWLIVAARTLQGVASACLWLAARAITADVVAEGERGRSFGSVDQSSGQGAILGTFIGFGVLMVRLRSPQASLNFTAGWRLLFIGYSAVSLLAALLALRRLPETSPTVRSPQARSASEPAARRPVTWSRPLALLLLVAAVTGASAAMIYPVLMIFLQEKLAVGPVDLANASLPAAIVGAVLPSRLGKLADRFGRKPLMVLGMAVAAGSSFLIPGLTGLASLAVIWALQALCYAAGDPAEQALVADLTGGDQRGRAYGLYALAGGLGATVGPMAGGWLYETIGPAAPFIANGVVLALCTLVLAVLLRVPTRSK